MNKALSWAIALVVGLGVLVYACGKVVLDSSSAVRDRAVETLRVTAMELPTHTERPLAEAQPAILPVSNGPATAETPPSSGDSCASWAGRWNALADSIDARGGTLLFNEISDLFQRLPALVGQPTASSVQSEGAWAALSVLASEWADEIDQARQLAAEYDPACPFSAEQVDSSPRYLNYVSLLRLGHVMSVHDGDFDAAIGGFAETMRVMFTRNEIYAMTPRITREDVELIFDAIRSGQVQAHTWDYLLAQLRETRHENFMRYYLLHYGEVPMKQRAEENVVAREWNRLIGQLAINRDLAEWMPVMQQLARLSEEPYYAIREDLFEVIASHNLGRGNDGSAGRRLVSMLATSRFVEQAHAQAANDLVRLAIALARYHEDHGVYPATLDATATYLGEPVPLNPRNGVPYHYETLEGIYRLGFGDEEASSLSNGATTVPEIGPEGAEFIRVPMQRAPRPKMAARSDGQPG